MELINKTAFNFAPLVGRIKFPSYSLTFIVKGTFDLKPSRAAALSEEQFFPTGDEFYPEDEDMIGGPKYPSDFAYIKPRTDLLLVGKCYAPEGRKVFSCPVKFQVGSKSKTLNVFGNRFWRQDFLGAIAGIAEPFSEIELRYENSFGGEGYETNPVGKGIKKIETGKGEKAYPLPNVLNLNDQISSPAVKLEPAGFGAYGQMWKQRSSKLGSYKGNYMKERWPWFPKDFDWGYFNSAPADMQVGGYLKGDEKLYFENLHPVHSQYHTRLPGLRIRCFSKEIDYKDAENTGSNGKKNFNEIKMNLDTLWVDMENEKLVLVWRGIKDIKNEEYEEIQNIFIVSEKLEEQPQSIDFYRQHLQKEFTEPEEEFKEEPAGTDESEDFEMEKVLAKAEEQMRAELIKAGIDPDNLPQPGEEDKRKEAELLKELGFEDEEEDIKLTREIFIERFKKGESFENVDLTGVDLSKLDLQGVNFTNAILNGVFFKDSDISKADFTGADLSGSNLSNAKLVNAVLKDADLTGGILIKADLTGAIIENAIFEKAQMNNALLNGVKGKDSHFTNADLTDAAILKSDLSGADFSKSKIDRADFTGAVLYEASLEGASGVQMNVSEADLTMLKASGGCNFVKAVFKKAKGLESTWEKANLTEADFSFSEMEGANFSAASLEKANLTSANMKFAKFAKANLTDAIVKDMNLFQGSFEKANLTRADCSRSNFYGVEFLDSITKETKFILTNLKMTKLAR